MEENYRQKRNRLAAEQVIRALQSRRMEGYYCATKAEALEQALALIPQGKTVGWGGSMSVEEIGLKDAVRRGDYQAIDRDKATDPKERMELMRQSLLAHTFLMGTNAITEGGELVNIDGFGNRVAALCFGPHQVLVIAGINKLTHDLNEAVARARHMAAPTNAARFDGQTPCGKTGLCGDCRAEDCICNQIVITRGSRPTGRIKVILVGEPLGY